MEHGTVLKRKNRQRCPDFTEADKKKLIYLVKNMKQVWDITDKLHSNTFALEAAWLEISKKMGKSQETCKKAWTSLRESYRYHTRVSKKALTTSDDPLNNDPNDGVDWPFAKHIAFLEQNRQSAEMFRRRRIECKIIDTPDNEEVTQHSYVNNVKEEQDTMIIVQNELEDYQNSPQIPEDVFDVDTTNPSMRSSMDDTTTGFEVNNEYEPNTSEIAETNHETFETGNIDQSSVLQKLDKIIQMQAKYDPSKQTNVVNRLVFQKQLVACDALLQQLPMKIAVSTLMDVQNYILKKINDHHIESLEPSV